MPLMRQADKEEEDFKMRAVDDITELMMEQIASFMNSDIREAVHYALAPCTNEEFLREYVKRVPEFADVLKTEFSIEL